MKRVISFLRSRLFMLRINRTVTTPSNTMMNSPIGPARPPDRVSPKLFSASSDISGTDRLPYTREQVVLWHLAVHK